MRSVNEFPQLLSSLWFYQIFFFWCHTGSVTLQTDHMAYFINPVTCHSDSSRLPLSLAYTCEVESLNLNISFSFISYHIFLFLYLPLCFTNLLSYHTFNYPFFFTVTSSSNVFLSFAENFSSSLALHFTTSPSLLHLPNLFLPHIPCIQLSLSPFPAFLCNMFLLLSFQHHSTSTSNFRIPLHLSYYLGFPPPFKHLHTFSPTFNFIYSLPSLFSSFRFATSLL